MATTEPLTGATVYSQSDAPLGGFQIGDAVTDLAPFTVPRFASTSARDSAFTSWVAAGNTMVTGLRCQVGGHLMEYVNSAWRYRDGEIAVADRTARDALVAYEGLRVHQADTGQSLVRVGSAWRLARPEMYQNNGMAAGWTNGATDWLGTSFGYVASDLGATITIPADGVARTVTIHATCQVAQDGWLRITRTAPSALNWPNANGKRSSSSAEVSVVINGGDTLDGTAAASYRIEARSQTTATADFKVPTLHILCT